MYEAKPIELVRRLAAEPEAVFAAFADPALVSRWLKPVREVRLEVLAFDFRPGGAYRLAYHVPDGSLMHVNGVFREIEPPKIVAFSWNIEPPDEHAGVRSEVRAEIAPAPGGSDLLIRHAQLDRPGASERHAAGWEGAAVLLAAVVAEQETLR
ncbi:MAG: SRPBCC domain-containing protein [Bauldia sp.]